MDVSCVSEHSRCISSHMAGAYTLSFFKIRGKLVEPVWVALDSPTKTFKGCILQPNSRAQWLKIWAKCTTYKRCVLHSALHHRGKQCPGESFTVPTLVQLHLLQGRKLEWGLKNRLAWPSFFQYFQEFRKKRRHCLLGQLAPPFQALWPQISRHLDPTSWRFNFALK